jgi:hypothetical protein
MITVVSGRPTREVARSGPTCLCCGSKGFPPPHIACGGAGRHGSQQNIHVKWTLHTVPVYSTPFAPSTVYGPKSNVPLELLESWKELNLYDESDAVHLRLQLPVTNLLWWKRVLGYTSLIRPRLHPSSTSTFWEHFWDYFSSTDNTVSPHNSLFFEHTNFFQD